MFRNILIGAFRASLVTLAIALATPAQVTPAQADVFTVTDVVVDESADSADAARQAAIDKAHVLALTALYQRIVIPEDIPGALVPPALDILPLVESFEILSEKIGKKRYQATLTFHFQADAIRQRLSASGVRFAETVSRPMVMLPVFGEGASARLWEEPNPWLHAWWNRLTDPTAFVPLVTPYGELEDVAAADAPEALGGDRAALQLLAGRYGAADALVAQLILSGDPEAGGASFVINVKRYGSTPGKADFSLNVAQEAGESAEALYARAASELAARIEVDWKRANAVYFGTEQNLAVSVTIAGLQDWLVVKRTLEGLPLVKELQVLSLSQSLASIVIHYRGTTDQLARALAQYDLLLTQGVAGWELRVAAVTGGQLQPKALEAPPPAPAAEPSPTPTPTP